MIASFATTKLLLNNSYKKLILVPLISVTLIIALPFAAVLAMGEETLSFLSSVPSLGAAEEIGFYAGGPVEGNTYAWGNCTYWAYSLRLWAGQPIPNTWGNANSWDDRAIRDGYIVNNQPAVGAIFQSDAGQWGHVAYVVEVNEAHGTWKISEMNYKGLNIVSTRSFSIHSASSYKFIHGKRDSHELHL